MSELKHSTDRRIAFARDYLNGLKRCLDTISLVQVAEIIGHLEEAYREGRQVFIIGNGGSAATASHMACDLAKGILPEEHRETVRRLRAIALTENVSWMMALANDLGYEHIFSEQLRNLARKDDLVIIISGSGDSPNVVEGARAAKSLGAKVVGILGFDGGQIKELADTCIIVANDNYGYIEDVHIALDHLFTAFLNAWIKDGLVAEKPNIS